MFKKLTIHPEPGLIIHKSVNIAVTGSLPFKLPVLSNPTYAYTISQAGIAIRYMFKRRKK